MFLLSYIQALSCLVQIASVRRSLFSNTERAKFLTHLVSGVKHILQNPQVILLNVVSILSQQTNNSLHGYFDYCLYVVQGLSDPSNYHEFCRLLARLKSNYQLGELVMVENYPEAIQLIAKFTVQSLQVCSETFDQPRSSAQYVEISVLLYEIIFYFWDYCSGGVYCMKPCHFV